MKKFYFSILLCCMSLATFALSTLAGGGLSSGVICFPQTNALVQSFIINQSGGAANLNSVTFNTTGTYTGASVTNYYLRYNTVNNIGTSGVIGLLPSAGAGTYTFTGLSATLADASPTYYWITVDVPGTATAGATFTASAMLSSAITVSSGGTSGVVSAAGTQTFDPTPAAITSTTSTFFICQGSCITVNCATAGGVFTSSASGTASVSGGNTVCGVSSSSATITYSIAGTCNSYATVTVNTSLPAISPALPVDVCVNSTTTLTDVVPLGTWSGGAPNASVNPITGVVTGISSGTANIIYTSGACSATKTISVDPPPVAIVGPTDSVCAFAENTVTLTDATPSGTWTSTFVTVTADASNEGIVRGVGGPGVGCVTYTIGSGCTSVKCLSVHAWPANIVGPDTICASLSTTLTDPSGGGTWSSSTASVATIVGGTGVVTGTGAGDAVITYSDNITHCYNMLNMHVYSFGPITGPTAVCQFGTASYSDTTLGGVWSTNPTTISTVNPITGVVTGLVAGLDSLIYSIAAHGCRTWDTIRVYNVPNTITGIAPLCVGSTLSLGDATPGGVWSTSPTTTATINPAGVVTGIAAGVVNVIYTNTVTGCYFSAPLTVNPLPAVITGTYAVCVGSTITLGDATATGTWSLSNGNAAAVSTTTTNIVLSGVNAGTDVLFYTLPITGCARTATITVNALPGPITGSLAVCATYTTSLSDGGTGTFTSYGAGASVATVPPPSTGVVTGNFASVDSIVYTLTATGCATYAFVTVNALPSPISGLSAVCVGSTITMTDLSSGTWSATPTGVGTINPAGVVTGISAGALMISYTTSPSGCFQTSLITVNPLPNPIAGATFDVCTGSTISLTDIDGGGTWTSNNPSIANFVDPSTGNLTGGATSVIETTTISYTLPTTCAVTHGVTVYPLPADIAGPTTVCLGSTITLTDGTFGGSWQSGNALIASVGGLTGYVTGVSAAVGANTVVITYTSAAGCYKTYIVTVNPLPGPIVSSATTVCANQLPITVYDTVVGGIWSTTTPLSINVTPIGIVGSQDQAGVQGTNGGICTIVYTLPGTGCFVTYTLTVNAAPEIQSTNNQFCVGDTVRLWDESLGGGWAPVSTSVASIFHTGVSATLDSALLTCLSPGTDNMGYFMTNGCSVFFTFQCNPVPVPITGAPFVVCQTNTLSLSDADGTGTFSAVNGDATVDPITGLVTGVTPGTDSVLYSFPIVGTAFAGCAAVAVVTVNPLLPITGIETVCAFGVTYLNDATPGSGSWSSGPLVSVVPLIVDPTTGQVTAGSAAGVDTVKYTMAGTGCVASAFVTVNNLPVPITGGNNVCVGQTITLFDFSGTGGWSSSMPSVATVDAVTGVVTGVSTGSVVITYTDGGTTCYVTQVLTVNAGPAAIVGPTEICPGVSVSYTDADAVTWASSDGTGLFIGTSTGIADGINAGVYTITATNGSGCAATLAVTVTTIDPITLVPPTMLPINICMGSTVLLADGTPGGTWSSSSMAIATINPATGYVTGIANGTVTITYQLIPGCIVLNSVNVNPITPIIGSDTLCEYLTTSLSDATLGGVWSSDNTGIVIISSSGIATGVDTGATTIHYVTSSGCTASTAVYVKGIGQINQATLLTSVCTGANITLTDTSSPFVPNPWSSGTPAAATITSGGVVTGVAVGTTIITYTASWGYAGYKCIAEYPITVNPSPAPIVGPDSLCEWGGTLIVSDATPGGIWSATVVTAMTLSDPSTALITAAGTGTPPGTSGTGIVTYTMPTGCLSTMVVTINPLPDPITGITSVCLGQTTTMHETTPLGSWSSSPTSIATVNPLTGVVTGIAPGIATIIYTLPTGCTATTIITVNIDAPIVGPSQLCSGVSAVYTDAVAGGTWTTAPTGFVTFAPTTGSPTTVTGTTAVPVAITLSYTLPGTSCTVTELVTLNPLPATITSTLNVICGTDSTQFTDVTLNSIWTSSPTSVATVDGGGWVTGTWTGIGAATATITYTDTITGCFVTAPVTVNPLGLIAPNNPNLCNGVPVNFTDAASGGIWTNTVPTTGAINAFTGVYTGIAFTVVDTILYTMPLTGCTSSLPITVYPQPGAITGPNMVCVGSIITLNDALIGGSWSATSVTGSVLPATTAPGTVAITGFTAGTATVTYMMPSGCFVTTDITVNPLPAPITGSTTVCGTDSIQLHDTSPFGTWMVSPITAASINSVTGELVAFATATVNSVVVTYSIPPAATSCAVTYTVNISALSLIVGPDHICSGVPTVFSDTVGVGVWSSSFTSIATVGSGTGIVTGHTNGADTIRYTISSTGCTTYELITVNASPAPISAPSFVCVGQTVSFTDATPGGVWSSHNTTIANINPINGVDTGISSGTVIISYSFGTGCYAVRTIIVDPLTPIVGPSVVCVGSEITLTDATPGGTWSSSAPLIDSVGLITTFPQSTAIDKGLSAGVAGTDTTVTISYVVASSGCTAHWIVTVNPLPDPIIAPAGLCHFDSAFISDSTHGGVWSFTPPVVIDSIGVVTANSTHFYGQSIGTVTLHYALPTGCTLSQLITVNPEALPMTGLFNLCVGQTTTLIDGPYSPPAPSGPGIWSTSPTGIVTINPTGIGWGYATALSPGTTLITYSTPEGCFAYHLLAVEAVVTPVVDILPNNGDTTSVTGVDRICAGQIPTFTFGETGGGFSPTYQWYVNTFPVSTSDISYTDIGPIATGDVIKLVMTSNANCATSATATDTWTMNVIPSIPASVVLTFSPSMPICSGNPVNFIATPTNGGAGPTYDWMINGTLVSTVGPTYTYLPNNGDVITVEMFSNAFCAAPVPVTSNSVTATVNPSLVDWVRIFANPGNTVNYWDPVFFTLEDSNYGFTPTYQWYVNGNPVIGAIYDTFTLTNPQNGDLVYCVMTTSNPCTTAKPAISDTIIMHIGNVSAPYVNNGFNDLALSPNPNNGSFKLKGSLNTVETGEVALEITDVLGKTIFRKTVSASSGKVDTDISLGDDVANGVYYLRITAGGESDVRHFMIER